ncbi:uncharacterized protein N7498_001715 [Penicillium cinerascens]|uniref:Uncharacterized protein n=1 Tax=Penicillium cinerascens TaxID=70096 RepID=A0A9W9N8N2_9EURO|nr:uncharacterized protein N7498_001715 [Penicillium cinerascens]KAJ5215308.1 hypothetical protein N7498_001715 [Penicillium cinerascens]
MPVLRNNKSTDAKAKGANSSGIQKNKGKINKQKVEKGKLLEQKAKAQQSRDARQKDLEALRQEVEDIQSRLKSEVSEDSKHRLEDELKEKLARCQGAEQSVGELNESIEQIEDDLMDIDEDTTQEPTHINETQASDTNTIEVQENDASTNETQASDMSTNETQGSDKNTNETQTSNTNNIESQENDANTNETQGSDTSTNEDSQLFVNQMESSLNNEGLDQEALGQPKDYKDYIFVDLTLDDEDNPDQLFEDGTVTLKKNSRSGLSYLNSYGPRNSAMTIWSSSAAPNEVKECTYLQGDPHRKAMDPDTTGKLLYKCKIGKIKRVAWQPKEEGITMLDLVESVEELNPEIKKTNPKYRYPLTTVLVDWKANIDLPDVWISRSDCKKLSSSAESTKIDRRIYAVALNQVRNYRNWAGKRLDNEWAGNKREGKDQSPSIPPESPEPEGQISAEAQNNQVQNSQVPNNQVQNSQVPNSQVPNNQVQNGQAQNDQAQNGQDQHSPSHAILSHGNEEDAQQESFSEEANQTENISDFYEIFMEKKDLDPNTPWKSMDNATFGEFVAATKSYIRHSKEQNIIVQDDMNFGKSFKKWI